MIGSSDVDVPFIETDSNAKSDRLFCRVYTRSEVELFMDVVFESTFYPKLFINIKKRFKMECKMWVKSINKTNKERSQRNKMAVFLNMT